MSIPILQRAFTHRALRRVTMLSATATGLYLIDTHMNAKAFQRTARTAWNGVLVGWDYKFNFTPGKADQINDLHQRVANRILHVCQTNGGLYIKLGQGIATNSSVLPPCYLTTLRALYDDASSVDYSTVEKIIHQELGRPIHEIFSSFSPEPVAAASIAQVHKAVLHDGTVVAVKVQKPEIKIQIEWDLKAYRWLIKVYEYLFDLPMSFAVDYTCKHLREETDFINEARNAEMCNDFLQTDSKLRQQVYVPKVLKAYSTKQVMVAEWVDGCRATDKQAIEQMGLSITKVMESVVDVFAHQIFISGFVHCDPHPGNILVRRHPDNPKRHQLLLLDHGLYMRESEEFRQQYCLFWKSLFLLDKQTIADICQLWGVGDSQMMANATLLKPYNMDRSPNIKPSTNTSVLDAYEIQMKLKTSLKDFLVNSELLPKELIFIGRNMTIVRANNKTLGSPVNRINRMARWAVRGLSHDSKFWIKRSSLSSSDQLIKSRSGHHDDDNNNNNSLSLRQPSSFWKLLSTTLQAQLDYWFFEAALALMSLTYHFAQLKSLFERKILGRKSDGFEAVLDDALKQRLEQEYGIKVEGDLFDA
ncbi:hypothetical protein BX616_003769 [Lobosporangium transversale]|uniref:ABC1 family-domain-containing protein n=1 Tax=Lobosporangium transversale TaxID=64571 RepID=A0A1Y2GG94_9FUNG|nr:ABC1 family-domain-containing protein [Lobosporangium transversale]KAF9898649.1 hypothetical protein BX616_003769 [Lobosporangium transversale]ORZ09023.1 ABC1 family-domain-containing protein [Lobosporangium transversale]|eukprot:XP_021878650.1 ABC1 family-domain-containing protein [Lobosporangium transversale]